jgi:hypothetical protein
MGVQEVRDVAHEPAFAIDGADAMTTPRQMHR